MKKYPSRRPTVSSYDTVNSTSVDRRSGFGRRPTRFGVSSGLLVVDEKGAPFRRSSFGWKWRKARTVVVLPDNFCFYDLCHTSQTLSTQSGATLKDTMARARTHQPR